MNATEVKRCWRLDVMDVVGGFTPGNVVLILRGEPVLAELAGESFIDADAISACDAVVNASLNAVHALDGLDVGVQSEDFVSDWVAELITDAERAQFLGYLSFSDFDERRSD